MFVINYLIKKILFMFGCIIMSLLKKYKEILNTIALGHKIP